MIHVLVLHTCAMCHQIHFTNKSIMQYSDLTDKNLQVTACFYLYLDQLCSVIVILETNDLIKIWHQQAPKHEYDPWRHQMSAQGKQGFSFLISGVLVFAAEIQTSGFTCYHFLINHRYPQTESSTLAIPVLNVWQRWGLHFCKPMIFHREFVHIRYMLLG